MGGVAQWEATKIFFTSNMDPIEWYPNVNDKSAFFRRVDQITHMTEPTVMQKRQRSIECEYPRATMRTRQCDSPKPRLCPDCGQSKTVCNRETDDSCFHCGRDWCEHRVPFSSPCNKGTCSRGQFGCN